MHPIDIILQKRDGHELSAEAIDSFVAAVIAGEPAITPAQIASFLMAVFQRGLTPAELAALTRAMRYSGETFDCSTLAPGTFTVDKHSTGGVGDKSSLLIAPTLAAAAARAAKSGSKLPPIAVPMISGRSLGHTGGTLDKLETIPGFNTQLDQPAMMDVLRRCHAVLMGQTPTLVPADRILYALRDHTGTVESPFLITASIMSKKLAEDLRGLVLDVKLGSGAFMPTPEASRHLAELMVETGRRAGTRTVALLTRMDEPMGRFSGNWVEVWECVDILKARTRDARHPMSRALVTLSNALSGHMLHLAGHAGTPEAGAALADDLLLSGEAWQAWLCIVAAQGGDVSVFDAPAAHHSPAATQVVCAPRDGFLAGMDCKQVGWAIQRLGAGRAVPGGPVSAHAGLESHARLGDRVSAGQRIFTLFTEDAALLAPAAQMIEATLVFSDTAPSPAPLIHDIITDIASA